MPKSQKGKEVFSDFMERYGKKKGKSVFYAKANKEGKGSMFYKLAHGNK